MDPMEIMRELLGYPYVGPSCREVIKVIQEVQANILDKTSAIAKLTEIKDKVKGKEINTPEHQKFNTALDQLVVKIPTMA